MPSVHLLRKHDTEVHAALVVYNVASGDRPIEGIRLFSIQIVPKISQSEGDFVPRIRANHPQGVSSVVEKSR